MTAILPMVYTDCCDPGKCFHIYVPTSSKQSPWGGSRVCIPTDGKMCRARDVQTLTGYSSLCRNRLPPVDRKIGYRQMVPIMTQMQGREKMIHLTSMRDVLYNCSKSFLRQNSDPSEWVGGAEALAEWYLQHEQYLKDHPLELSQLSRELSYLTLKPTPSPTTTKPDITGVFDPKYKYAKDIKIQQSSIPNAGKGVFTLKSHKRGTIIGKYVGRLIPRADLAKMTPQQINKIISFVDGTGREHLIDGQGCNHFSSFINHKWRRAQNPLGAANIATDNTGQLIALRDIAEGEELFMDYGVKYWAFQLLKTDIDEMQDSLDQIQVQKQVYDLLPN